jgi:FkbM family methyltransferase
MRSSLLRCYRWLFARPALLPFNRLLYDCSLRGLGVLNYESSRISGEDHLIREVLSSRVGRDERPVFFDVGANVGAYTRLLSDRFPNALIHAFEPHPVSYQRLVAAIGSERVRCHNLALGERSETATLYDRSDAGGSEHASMFAGVIREIHRQDVQSIEIRVSTLDEIAAAEGISRIDFLKIDAEGNELAVLKGGRQLLERRAIGCVQFEFNEMNVISRSFLRDFRKLLPGYRLFRLLPRGRLEITDEPIMSEIFAYQNVIGLPG